MSLPALITNKLLGTTVQVRVKRYGDGMIAYQEVTAGKAEQRKHPGESDPEFDAGIIKALATVT